MTDLIDRMKEALEDPNSVISRQTVAEAIDEIEELRAAINGKTFTVLSDDGEAWKARAEAAEAKLDEIGEKP